jgi:hypothetical protein
MPARSQIRNGRGCWLVEIAVAGAVFRFADRPARITRASTGQVEVWSEGLEDLGAAPRSTQSVSVTIAPFVVDWAKLVARGVDLGAGRAILRRWYEGQTLEEAEVLVEGVVEEPEWGAKSEPLTFHIAELPWQDRTFLPTSSMRITPSTWPVRSFYSIDAPALDAYYPIPIGSPGAPPTVVITASSPRARRTWSSTRRARTSC